MPPCGNDDCCQSNYCYDCEDKDGQIDKLEKERDQLDRQVRDLERENERLEREVANSRD